MTSLFSARDYRAFLKEKIDENRNVRGYQSRLAEAAGVHTSYISRVINGHLQLTPDQAAGLAKFWALEPDETDYFLDLVLLERSSTPVLRARLTQRLEAIRRGRERLRERFARARSLEQGMREDRYYSAWYFAAIHMVLTIPKYRRPADVARRLGLTEELVASALATLQELGLARRAPSGTWAAQSLDLHVGEDRAWARVQHGHWRQKAALKIQDGDPDALHYSGVHTMSVSDARKLRQLLVQFLDRSRAIVAPSPEEELFFLGCDFFVV